MDPGLYLDEPFLILTPILYESKMPGTIRIMEDLEESTFRLRSHSIEAGLEGGEERVDVLGSDRDCDMQANTMKCMRILHVGRHDGCCQELDCVLNSVFNMNRMLARYLT